MDYMLFLIPALFCFKQKLDKLKLLLKTSFSLIFLKNQVIIEMLFFKFNRSFSFFLAINSFII